eukprot:357640-Chlamydomonas_euryale.AAC.2
MQKDIDVNAAACRLLSFHCGRVPQVRHHEAAGDHGVSVQHAQLVVGERWKDATDAIAELVDANGRPLAVGIVESTARTKEVGVRRRLLLDAAVDVHQRPDRMGIGETIAVGNVTRSKRILLGLDSAIGRGPGIHG